MACNYELYICTISMGNFVIALTLIVAGVIIQLFTVLSDWYDWYEQWKDKRDK